MALTPEEKKRMLVLLTLISQGKSGKNVLAAIQPILAMIESKQSKEKAEKATRQAQTNALIGQTVGTVGTLGGTALLLNATKASSPTVSTETTMPSQLGGEWGTSSNVNSSTGGTSTENVTIDVAEKLPPEMLNDSEFMSTVDWGKVGQGAISVLQVLQAWNQWKNGDKTGAAITASGATINAASALGSQTAAEVAPYVGPAIEVYQGAKSQFDKNKTDEQRSYDAAMTVPRAAAAYYTAGLSTLAEAFARKQWGGTMKKFDKFMANNPASPIFVPMQASRLWTSDKWKTEGNRLRELEKQGVVIPDQYRFSMNQKRGMSKDELVAMAKATGGNVDFEQTRDEKFLRPQDVVGKAAFIERYGADWFGKFTQAQREAIAGKALAAGAVREHHGTYDVDWSKVPDAPPPTTPQGASTQQPGLVPAPTGTNAGPMTPAPRPTNQTAQMAQPSNQFMAAPPIPPVTRPSTTPTAQSTNQPVQQQAQQSAQFPQSVQSPGQAPLPPASTDAQNANGSNMTPNTDKPDSTGLLALMRLLGKDKVEIKKGMGGLLSLVQQNAARRSGAAV